MIGPQENESHPWDPEDDGEEYALLPPDPDVLEEERRRRDAQIAAWEAKAAADQDPNEDPWNIDIEFQFRFGIKDLLAAMAILAISITCVRLLDPYTGFSIFVLGTLIWMQYRLVCSEKETARKKKPPRTAPTMPFAGSSWRDWIRPWRSYSIADMLIAITVAAIVFALLRWMGPAYTTAFLGMMVTAGILAYMLDFRPPRQWWLVWILVCVCYVVFAIVTSIRIRFFS
ncbi:MAG: hypothetical protein JW829_13880 [Pirellulales bacterium]|nr:hypothetical protein [Pirellulales bacterium]